jgi:hypothetical protein
MYEKISRIRIARTFKNKSLDFCKSEADFIINQANRGTGKNMATLNYKFIFFALTSECENQCSVVLSQMASNRLIFDV